MSGMDHARAQELFEAYYAGGLDRPTMRAFHAHLNECPECQVRVRAMRAAAEARAGWRRGEEREDRLAQVMVRNRIFTYALIALAAAFFLLWRWMRGVPRV